MERELVGRSAAHRRTVDRIERVADSGVEVLLTGPSGVGKELYARLLHARSRRASRAFVPVNCGAVPATLFENEFFGHGAGAFTGATGRTEGYVESAEGGTLFLDEVDALPLNLQVKLLRFLQEKEYRRLGETRQRKANVRICAATNCDLVSRTREGRFRQDLFFRLRVAPIDVPALVERIEDVGPMAEHFAEQCAREYGTDEIVFSQAATRALLRYHWPGNVRELQNCVRFLTALQLDREIQPEDLPLLSLGAEDSEEGGVRDDEWDTLDVPFQDAKAEVVGAFEQIYLRRALERAGGNITHAAKASGKNRRAFFELLRKHGIDAAAFRA